MKVKVTKLCLCVLRKCVVEVVKPGLVGLRRDRSTLAAAREPHLTLDHHLKISQH
jgi:hypothetical protein